jgi:hypothetical protein
MKGKNYVDDALAQFQDGDVTVRVMQAISTSVPFAPKLPTYRSVGDCALTFYPNASPEAVNLVYKLAQQDNVQKALSAASWIDTGDTGIAIYSGISSALTMFFGKSTRALETDTEQGVDSALKLLGIAYIVHQLFPGSPTEKATSFYATPAGQALGFYFASIDVALPFADNVLVAGGSAIQTLFSRHGGAAASKLASMPGGSQVAQEAQSMLGSLVAPLEHAVQSVAPHARAIANSTMKHLPGVMSAADKVAGVVATGADVLPVYRYLVARLAAEACVMQASRSMPG